MRVNVVEGNVYSDDAVFDIVHQFEHVTLRTLYTFVKEYAMEIAKKKDNCLVEMCESRNGLPFAQLYVDGTIRTAIYSHDNRLDYRM